MRQAARTMAAVLRIIFFRVKLCRRGGRTMYVRVGELPTRAYRK